jgi:large subunit ribosomal protein L7/L12
MTLDVVLVSIGDLKISVIKEVKDISGAGLAATKELVESAPTTLFEDVPHDEAVSIRTRLEAVGATVQLR